MSNWKNVGPPEELNQLGRPRTVYPHPYYPYPKEYDARIHGPYDPARNYGVAKRRLWDVKLGELPSFLLKANWSPKNVINHGHRWLAGWHRDNMRCAKTPVMPLFQIIVFGMVMIVIGKSGYLPTSSGGFKTEALRKYHW